MVHINQIDCIQSPSNAVWCGSGTPPRRSNKAFTRRNNCKDIQKKITSLTTSHGRIPDLQTSTAQPQSSLRNGKTSRRKSTRGDGWAPSVKIDNSIYSIICFMLHFFHLNNTDVSKNQNTGLSFYSEKETLTLKFV